MTDKQQVINLGEEAARLLENPAFLEMWSRMESAINLAWVECSVRDKEAQTLLLQQAKLLKMMKESITGMVQAGYMESQKMAIKSLEEPKSLMGSLRSVVGNRVRG